MALTLTTTTRSDTGTSIFVEFVLVATAPDSIAELFLVRRTGDESVSADTSEFLAVVSPEDIMLRSTSADSDDILRSSSASVVFATEAKFDEFAEDLNADLSAIADLLLEERMTEESVSGSDAFSASSALVTAPFFFSA